MFSGGIFMQLFFVRTKNLVPILFLILVIILLMINMFAAKEYIFQASKQYSDDIPIYSVECEERKCAITFDCAWGADDIPSILDTLDRYNAKGTFFIVGLWAKKYPDTVKLIYERDHEIANHGYSHAHMAQIPEDKIEEEILFCTRVLEEITGFRTNLFRPPYGEYNSTTVKVAKNLQYYTIQWDVDSLDWKKNMSKEEIFKRVKIFVKDSFNDVYYRLLHYPVSYSGYAKQSFTSIRFLYLYSLHRAWFICVGFQFPMKKLNIFLKLNVEIFNRLPIYSWRSMVSFYPFEGFCQIFWLIYFINQAVPFLHVPPPILWYPFPVTRSSYMFFLGFR
jgi:peptidoglycan/xylan/chitin deacetylase (PgdA/CDA1 family)